MNKISQSIIAIVGKWLGLKFLEIIPSKSKKTHCLMERRINVS